MAEVRARSWASNVEEPPPTSQGLDRNGALTGIYPLIPLAQHEAAQEGWQHCLRDGKVPQSYVQSHKCQGCEKMQAGRRAGKRHEPPQGLERGPEMLSES